MLQGLLFLLLPYTGPHQGAASAVTRCCMSSRLSATSALLNLAGQSLTGHRQQTGGNLIALMKGMWKVAHGMHMSITAGALGDCGSVIHNVDPVDGKTCHSRIQHGVLCPSRPLLAHLAAAWRPAHSRVLGSVPL
jgi:hypothetical protein